MQHCRAHFCNITGPLVLKAKNSLAVPSVFGLVVRPAWHSDHLRPLFVEDVFRQSAEIVAVSVPVHQFTLNACIKTLIQVVPFGGHLLKHACFDDNVTEAKILIFNKTIAHGHYGHCVGWALNAGQNAEFLVEA